MSTAYKAKPGFVANPLLKYPRNRVCPCGSGEKFKSCCLKVMTRYVTADLADRYQKGMRNINLIKFDKPAPTIAAPGSPDNAMFNAADSDEVEAAG